MRCNTKVGDIKNKRNDKLTVDLNRKDEHKRKAKRLEN